MSKNKLYTIIYILSLIMILFFWWQEHQKRLSLETQLIEKVKSVKTHTLNPVGVAVPIITVSKETTISALPTFTQKAEMPIPTLSPFSLYGIESGISGIEKIVPINQEQRARLKDKFTNEVLAKQRGIKPNTESLSDIIGEENSKFYQERVANAFKKSQEQEIDREIFYLSRRLNFNTGQEQQMRQLLSEVESQVSQRFQSEKNSPTYQQDPGYRVRLMIQENNFRKEWLESELQKILSAEQFQAYLQEEADSAASELNTWHAP